MNIVITLQIWQFVKNTDWSIPPFIKSSFIFWNSMWRPFCNFKAPRKATFWKPCNTFRRVVLLSGNLSSHYWTRRITTPLRR
eukprot:symbB.v1.2.025453.t1/scaffold2470.1/size78466/1